MSEAETLLGEPVTTTVEDENYLDALVGEGKKYASPQELAKAYIHADRHINELKLELEENNTHKQTMEEILTALRSKTPPASGNPPPAQGDVNAEDVSKLVENALVAKEREREAKRIRAETLDKLTQLYGEKKAAMGRVNKIVTQYPHLREVIDRLGDTDSDACVRLIQSYEPVVEPLPNTPGLSNEGPSASIVVGTGSQLTWTQCQEIRKKNPKLYNSTAFRQQMEKVAAMYTAKGKDFFAT